MFKKKNEKKLVSRRSCKYFPSKFKHSLQKAMQTQAKQKLEWCLLESDWYIKPTGTGGEKGYFFMGSKELWRDL